MEDARSDRLASLAAWIEEHLTATIDVEARAAAQAGFSGSDHLIRAFSRRFGVTPAACRQILGRQGLEARAAAE
jgi:AraC-like DNA-binding protein